MCHVFPERNRSQLFKETRKTFMSVICLKVQRYADLIFLAFLRYTSMLLVHCLGDLCILRLVDQQRRQLEVIFYFKCYIMGSGAGLLVREIRLATGWWNHELHAIACNPYGFDK